MNFQELVRKYQEENGMTLRMAIVTIGKNHPEVLELYRAGMENSGEVIAKPKVQMQHSEETIARRKRMGREIQRRAENARKVLKAYLDDDPKIREIVLKTPEKREAFKRVVRETLGEYRKKDAGEFYRMVKAESGLTREEVDLFLS